MTNIMNALAHATGVELAIAATRTSTLTGSAVDIQDYEGPCLIILEAGRASAGTTPTLNVKIQHSPTTTGGDFADLSGAAFTQVTDAAGGGIEVLKFNASNLKRYLRVIGTIAGTNTPTFAFTVVFVGTKKTV